MADCYSVPAQPLFVIYLFMEIFADLLKIVLPALIVLYAMYMLVKAFLNRELHRIQLEGRNQRQETVLPIRLQAYERIVLFLERITPSNLLLRINGADFTAREYQHVLMHEIREEFNHNLSQQVYMSHEAWEAVRAAKEEVIALINQQVEALPEDAGSQALKRNMLEYQYQKGFDPTGRAMEKVKAETMELF